MGSSIRSVLLIDDDPRILARSRQLLEYDGFQAHTAQTSDAARSITVASQPDLTIVDAFLGSESGLDVAAEVRRMNGRTRLVVWTGYASMELGFWAARIGVEMVISKPVTPREVLAQLAGSYPVRPALARTSTLDNAKREHVLRVLGDAEGNISEAARRLKVPRYTLQRWLRRWAPEREQRDSG